ncbi:hypothetical protein [Limosilactobacillus reuteri]
MLLFGTFLIALVSSLIVVWFSWWLNNRRH